MTENGSQKYHPLHIDKNTIDDSQTPTQPAGVWSVIGMLANRLKQATGRSTWQDSPPTNLTEARAHHDATGNVHNLTRAQLGAAAQTALESHIAARDNPHAVTAAQAGARPSSYVPSWSEITSKPSTYPSTWNTVSGKPSSFTPSAHAHAITDLPVAASGVASATQIVRADDERLVDTTSGTPYLTDGSTPLKYSAFLAEAGGDHQQAMQAAIDALYTGSGAYQMHLDLEGANITLLSPIDVPTGGFQVRSVFNGQIQAGASWAGDYLLRFLGAANQLLKFHNVTFIGSQVANWITWDEGDLHFSACNFRHNAPYGGDETFAGLRATGNAHYHIRNNCHFTCPDGATLPTDRERIFVYGDKADNKIESAIMSYARHAIVNPGGTLMVNDLHIFQGQSGQTNTTAHTAGIKMTGGMAGSEIGSVYLDKCFIEVSNQHNSAAASIGGVTIQQLKTLLTSAEANFAYVVIRDYHAKTGLTVRNVVITESEFVNYGTALAYPTLLYDPASFDQNSFDQIHMRDNTFIQNIQPQSNPVTVRHEQSTASVSKAVSMAGMFPFSSRPNLVLSVAARPSSGTPGGLYVGNVNRIGQAVAVNSATAYAGTTVVTATANLAGAGGFVAS